MTKRLTFTNKSIWLMLIFLSISFAVLKGSNVNFKLPKKFHRITTLQEIISGECYLIGAEGIDKRFSLMQVKSDNSSVAGLHVGEMQNAYEANSTQAIWRIELGEENTVYLQSVENSKYLYTPSPEKSNLKFSSSPNRTWILRDNHDGTFSLINQKEPTRAIGISDYKDKVYFGNYKETACDTWRLTFFRTSESTLEGNATLPENGTRLFLATQENVLLFQENKWVENKTDGHLLNDGSIACDKTFRYWTCQSYENRTFDLQKEDGTSLSQVLGLPSHTKLIIHHGYYATNEEKPRFLVHVPEGGLVLTDSINQAKHEPIRLLRSSEPPEIVYSEFLTTLKGGWSASALADLEWGNARLLDLTEIRLPVQGERFRKRPQDQNTIVYISQEDERVCHPEWDFVVSCKKEGENHLLRKGKICDRVPFHTSRTFRAEEGMLTYEREAYTDGGWETLYLPFEATLPKGFHLEKLEDFDGENLIFSPSENISANTPYILRYCEETKEQKVPLLLYSATCEITAEEQTPDFFNGVYDTLYIANESVYLLNKTGNAFVKAAAGSRLYPFRAFIQPTNDLRRINIRHVVANASENITTKSGEQTKTYTSSGILVGKGLSRKRIKELPKGVYIIGNKKYIR